MWFLLTALIVASFIQQGLAQSREEIEPSPSGRKASQNGQLGTADVVPAQQLLQEVSADVISLEEAPAMGDERARVAIVEFGDYQCAYCGQHATQTLPQIVTDYVKTGKVRYFFKDFPIEDLHPQAFKAAETARCAGEQGAYWQMHDRLFNDQSIVVVNVARTYALSFGMDLQKFQHCLGDGTYAAQIRKDILEGKKLNVPGTPQFFFGTLDAQGTAMKVVATLGGAFPYSAFQQVLDQMLSPPSEGNGKQ